MFLRLRWSFIAGVYLDEGDGMAAISEQQHTTSEERSLSCLALAKADLQLLDHSVQPFSLKECHYSQLLTAILPFSNEKGSVKQLQKT